MPKKVSKKSSTKRFHLFKVCIFMLWLMAVNAARELPKTRTITITRTISKAKVLQTNLQHFMNKIDPSVPTLTEQMDISLLSTSKEIPFELPYPIPSERTLVDVTKSAKDEAYLPQSVFAKSSHFRNYVTHMELVSSIQKPNTTDAIIYASAVQDGGSVTLQISASIDVGYPDILHAWELQMFTNASTLQIDFNSTFTTTPLYTLPITVVSEKQDALKIIASGKKEILDGRVTTSDMFKGNVYLGKVVFQGSTVQDVETAINTGTLQMKCPSLYNYIGKMINVNTSIQYIGNGTVTQIPSLEKFPEKPMNDDYKDMIDNNPSMKYLLDKIGGSPEYQAIETAMSWIYRIYKNNELLKDSDQYGVFTYPVWDSTFRVIRLPIIVYLRPPTRLVSWQIRFRSINNIFVMEPKNITERSNKPFSGKDCPLFAGSLKGIEDFPDYPHQEMTMSVPDAKGDVKTDILNNFIPTTTLIMKPPNNFETYVGEGSGLSMLNFLLVNPNNIAFMFDSLVNSLAQPITRDRPSITLIPSNYHNGTKLIRIPGSEVFRQAPLPPAPLPQAPLPQAPWGPLEQSSRPSSTNLSYPPSPSPSPPMQPYLPSEAKLKELTNAVIGLGVGIPVGLMIFLMCMFIIVNYIKRTNRVHDSSEQASEFTNIRIPENQIVLQNYLGTFHRLMQQSQSEQQTQNLITSALVYYFQNALQTNELPPPPPPANIFDPLSQAYRGSRASRASRAIQYAPQQPNQERQEIGKLPGSVNDNSHQGGSLDSLLSKKRLLEMNKQSLLKIVKQWNVKGMTGSTKEDLVDMIHKTYKKYKRAQNKNKHI